MIHHSSAWPRSLGSLATPLGKGILGATTVESIVQSDHLTRFRDKYFDCRGRILNLRVLVINSSAETMHDTHLILTLRTHVVVEADSSSVAEAMVHHALTAESFGSDRAGFQVIVVGREVGGESAAAVAERMRAVGFDGMIIEMHDSPPNPVDLCIFKQRGGDFFLQQPFFSFQVFWATITGTIQR